MNPKIAIRRETDSDVSAITEVTAAAPHLPVTKPLAGYKNG